MTAKATFKIKKYGKAHVVVIPKALIDSGVFSFGQTVVVSNTEPEN